VDMRARYRRAVSTASAAIMTGAAVLAVVSCGSAVPAASGKPSGPSGQVTLSASDDGARVVVKPGQTIIVVLAGKGMLRWNPIRLADLPPAALRQLSAAGGYPSRAPARASYRAIRAGTAEILSGTNAPCLHAHPRCAIVQRSWRVTVVVR